MAAHLVGRIQPPPISPLGVDTAPRHRAAPPSSERRVTPRVGIVGAGILGTVARAAPRRRRGAQVTLLERAPTPGRARRRDRLRRPPRRPLLPRDRALRRAHDRARRGARAAERAELHAGRRRLLRRRRDAPVQRDRRLPALPAALAARARAAGVVRRCSASCAATTPPLENKPLRALADAPLRAGASWSASGARCSTRASTRRPRRAARDLPVGAHQPHALAPATAAAAARRWAACAAVTNGWSLAAAERARRARRRGPPRRGRRRARARRATARSPACASTARHERFDLTIPTLQPPALRRLLPGELRAAARRLPAALPRRRLPGARSCAARCCPTTRSTSATPRRSRPSSRPRTWSAPSTPTACGWPTCPSTASPARPSSARTTSRSTGASPRCSRAGARLHRRRRRRLDGPARAAGRAGPRARPRAAHGAAVARGRGPRAGLGQPGLSAAAQRRVDRRARRAASPREALARVLRGAACRAREPLRPRGLTRAATRPRAASVQLVDQPEVALALMLPGDLAPAARGAAARSPARLERVGAHQLDRRAPESSGSPGVNCASPRSRSSRRCRAAARRGRAGPCGRTRGASPAAAAR